MDNPIQKIGRGATRELPLRSPRDARLDFDKAPA